MKSFRFKVGDILKRKWNMTQLSDRYPKNIMVLECILRDEQDLFFNDKYFLLDLDNGKRYHDTTLTIHQSYSRVG